jgi:hypothetical protein
MDKYARWRLGAETNRRGTVKCSIYGRGFGAVAGY